MVNERAPEPTPEIIDSVPGVTRVPTEKATEGVSSETPSQPQEWGGYTGHRVDSNGGNPNIPVINDPQKLAMLDAAGKTAQPIETPKQ